MFETHSWSEDNDSGRASGWNHSRLSTKGRALAAELGDRRRSDGINAVFTSDLRRAVETAEIAFAGTGIPILHDWRLRECNYGTGNGMPAVELHHDQAAHLDQPYPDGESWTQAIDRVGWFLRDLRASHDGSRVLVIGHVATRWGLQHHLDGCPLPRGHPRSAAKVPRGRLTAPAGVSLCKWFANGRQWHQTAGSGK